MDNDAPQPPTPIDVSDVVLQVLTPFLIAQFNSTHLALVESRAENATLREEMAEMDASNADLTAQLAESQAQNAEIDARLVEQEARIAELEAGHAEHEARIAKLEAQAAQLELLTSQQAEDSAIISELRTGTENHSET